MRAIKQILVLTSALSFVAVASADDQYAIRETYVKLNSGFQAPTFEKARSIIASISAPGFAYYDAQGKKETGAQVMEMMKQMIASTPDRSQMQTKVISVQIHGSSARAKSVQSFVGKVKMGDGKMHTMSSSSTSNDDLVKINGTWKFKTVHEVSNKTTLDGKPMKM